MSGGRWRPDTRPPIQRPIRRRCALTRIVLVTGKGGVGKTSVAAATAARIAADGARVLVTSTDPAHSLADALCQPLGDEPATVVPPAGATPWSPDGVLQAQQIDAQARLERHWGAIRDYLTTVLAAGGMDEVHAEELVVFPGLDELFSLIDLRRRVSSGGFDVVVVDCAPTAETLRLLALPDALRWYAGRLLGTGRQLARAARPLQRGRGDRRPWPIPGEHVFGAVEEVHEDLAAVHELLQDPDRASVRLVTNPERLAVAEAMRTATSLSLFGYPLDAVIANRILPGHVSDPYLRTWQGRHAEHLATLREAFAPMDVRRAPLLEDEPLGIPALLELADHVYPDGEAAAVLHSSVPLELVSDGRDRLLRVALPFAATDDLEIHRHGDELHLKVSGVRRRLTLPSSLRTSGVVAARLQDGHLTLRLRPAEHAEVGA